jgi:predicted metal-dependent peptidase
MKINPDFWLSLTDDVRTSLLAHEAWHVAFGHIILPLGVDPGRFNEAADYVINIMLKDTKFTIPNEWLCESRYRDMSTMEVYNTLPPPDPNEEKTPVGIGYGIGQDIESPDDNQSDSDIENLKSEIESNIVKATTMAEMNGEGVGTLPGDIQEIIDNLVNPKLDWRTILQNYMTDFNKTDYSFRRPNKRYMPDFYLPSLHGESMGELAAFRDTSGSVNTTELTAFMSEIADIKEKLNPLVTTVGDFDTSIKEIHKFTKDEAMPNIPCVGRGGTDLECVFEYFKDNPPELLIIFSDLWCDKIEEDPGYPVIWVCVNNTDAEVNFGKLIHLTL